MPVPHPDVVAAALQTESADFASIRRSYIGNNPAHHDVLDALAVRARYGTDLLSEESSAFVNLGFVATLAAAIFEFPSHIITEKRFNGSKEKSTTILKISLQASLSTHRSVVLGENLSIRGDEDGFWKCQSFAVLGQNMCCISLSSSAFLSCRDHTTKPRSQAIHNDLFQHIPKADAIYPLCRATPCRDTEDLQPVFPIPNSSI